MKKLNCLHTQCRKLISSLSLKNRCRVYTNVTPHFTKSSTFQACVPLQIFNTYLVHHLFRSSKLHQSCMHTINFQLPEDLYHTWDFWSKICPKQSITKLSPYYMYQCRLVGIVIKLNCMTWSILYLLIYFGSALNF